MAPTVHEETKKNNFRVAFFSFDYVCSSIISENIYVLPYHVCSAVVLQFSSFRWSSSCGFLNASIDRRIHKCLSADEGFFQKRKRERRNMLKTLIGHLPSDASSSPPNTFCQLSYNLEISLLGPKTLASIFFKSDFRLRFLIPKHLLTTFIKHRNIASVTEKLTRERFQLANRF